MLLNPTKQTIKYTFQYTFPQSFTNTISVLTNISFISKLNNYGIIKKIEKLGETSLGNIIKISLKDNNIFTFDSDYLYYQENFQYIIKKKLYEINGNKINDFIYCKVTFYCNTFLNSTFFVFKISGDFEYLSKKFNIQNYNIYLNKIYLKNIFQFLYKKLLNYEMQFSLYESIIINKDINYLINTILNIPYLFHLLEISNHRTLVYGKKGKIGYKISVINLSTNTIIKYTLINVKKTKDKISFFFHNNNNNHHIYISLFKIYNNYTFFQINLGLNMSLKGTIINNISNGIKKLLKKFRKEIEI
jgi:hypothetical protein